MALWHSWGPARCSKFCYLTLPTRQDSTMPRQRTHLASVLKLYLAGLSALTAGSLRFGMLDFPRSSLHQRLFFSSVKHKKRNPNSIAYPTFFPYSWGSHFFLLNCDSLVNWQCLKCLFLIDKWIPNSSYQKMCFCLYSGACFEKKKNSSNGFDI